MRIPLLDMTRKYRALAAELHQSWNGIFASMQLLNGRNLLAFEQEFAYYCNVRHAIGVASGTDAILLSLRALGLSQDDEVILAAHSPAPVVEPVLAVGAVPVLVDKARHDYGPDIDSLSAALTPKTRAVIAVHLLGLPCDMDGILEIVRGKNIWVVEDASQAQGAIYKRQRAAGLGILTPMSLGPVKNLACYGDGGIVLTNDSRLAESIRLLRVHGQIEKSNHIVYGWNSRLDEIQAAILRIKLPTLDLDNARRREIARRYSESFRDLPLTIPPSFPDRVSVYHQYVVETPKRDSLRMFLEKKGVGTGMYYSLCLHQHEAWQTKALRKYSLPEAERYARQNLALPVFAELTNQEVDYVITAVRDYFSPGHV
jgi:dTDP-4-amino-4,6-dideoxygalactose transaminase